MGVGVNSSAPIASDAELSRSNQMIQEQWRTRCGSGGGKSARAEKINALALEGIASIGCTDGNANNSGAINFGATETAVRSTGRRLQLHLPT
jgi:hypothetical protein